MVNRLHGRQAGLAACLLAVIGLSAGACGSGSRTAASTASGSTQVSTATPLTSASDLDTVTERAQSEPEPAAMPKSIPVSIDIPKIGAKSSLIPLGLNADGTIQVPPVSQPKQAGWFTGGPTPGEIGPAVILGHVDGMKMPGVFYGLRQLQPGDIVHVARQDNSTATFVVRKNQVVPKTNFPTEQVYGDTTDAELRLITCGGAFDRTTRNYVDNIIIYARLSP
jgi:sortase (surface protein transpeptidase)